MKVHATTNVPYFTKATVHGWDIVKVQSDSNPNKHYTVDVTHGRCSCPAWIYSKAQNNGLKPTCKHLKRLHFRGISNEPIIAEPKKQVGVGVKIKEKM